MPTGGPAMRVAALYDIHGNLPALESVLDELFLEGVDEVLVGGDVVPGPMPGASLEALLELPLPVRFILGNGEADLLALRRGEELSRVPEPFREAFRWVAEVLPPRYLDRISEWPSTVRVHLEGLGEVLFCHATPRDDNELFTRITPEDRLRPIFEATSSQVVVCGHTHMQFDRRIGETRVVNAGSVGMPFGEPGAYWVMLRPGRVELRRTLYDVDDATERMHRTGYPGAAELELRRPPSESEMIATFEAAALR